MWATGSLVSLVLLAAVCAAAVVAEAPPPYSLERLSLNVIDPKKRMNGPSLVKLPHWLHKDARPFKWVSGKKRRAQWFLYFGIHSGPNIYLVWATDEVLTSETKWYRHSKRGRKAYKPVASLSSFDGLPNLSKKEPDLGSPDVMLDHTGQLFVLYLHTAFGCSSSRPDKGGTAQCTFALISNNGRKFRWAEETPPQALAHSYLRPFYLYEHNTLHGLANEAELFHAPPTGEILTQPEQELKKQMTWEPDNNITQVLYDYVASVASETAKLNHVGLAFVTPTLLEVSFSIKYTSNEDGPRRRFGKILTAYLNASDPDPQHWAYLTADDGTPIVQTLLSKRQLRINGGSKKFSYPSDSDIVVARDRTGACHRYLTVAYGRKNRGEGRMALFRLTRDPSFFDGGIDPCWQNDHPAVFGFGDDRPSSLGAKDGKGTLGDPPL